MFDLWYHFSEILCPTIFTTMKMSHSTNTSHHLRSISIGAIHLGGVAWRRQVSTQQFVPYASSSWMWRGRMSQSFVCVRGFRLFLCYGKLRLTSIVNKKSICGAVSLVFGLWSLVFGLWCGLFSCVQWSHQTPLDTRRTWVNDSKSKYVSFSSWC